MDKFIFIKDEHDREHIVSVSHISRISKRIEYNSVHREYYYRYCVDVAGAVDGMSCGARIDISEQKYNELKEEFLNHGN